MTRIRRIKRIPCSVPIFFSHPIEPPEPPTPQSWRCIVKLPLKTPAFPFSEKWKGISTYLVTPFVVAQFYLGAFSWQCRDIYFSRRVFLCFDAPFIIIYIALFF